MIKKTSNAEGIIGKLRELEVHLLRSSADP
jgi:hypothetical protein